MPDRLFRPGEQHPPHWRQDLNPEPLAGINYGPATEPDPALMRTAFDVKSIHRRLVDEFRDDELKRIPLLPRGQRLEQGARYYDICEERELTALGNQVAERDGCLVPKSEVDYLLWNRLRRVQNPERVGLADEGATG